MRLSKHIKATAIALAALLLFWGFLNILPPKKNLQQNPFLVGEGNLPMIAAHRGGGMCNPENTMLAFRCAVQDYGVQVIESDLYLTKDGYLVYNHDAYIDETCNVNGDISLAEVKALCADESKRHYIRDMTLEELSQYNFGYYFKDENGERIYKDVADHAALGLQIATVDELFAAFCETHPDLLFIVEIKDSGLRGYQACRILAQTLESYAVYLDNVVVGSFNPDVEACLVLRYQTLLRGASTTSAMAFILSEMISANALDTNSFACLQIPATYNLYITTVKLDNARYVARAHSRNIAVQYWTVNDEETMRKLIEIGCDCIITDNPALLSRVLEDYR